MILNEENITGYQGLLPPDLAENMGRRGYDGVIQGQSALVWRQSSAKGTGKILFYTAEDAGTADALLAEYEEKLVHAGILKSGLELSSDLGKVEQEALAGRGYLLRTAESSILHTTVSDLALLPVAARCELPQTIRNTGTLSIRQFRQGILTQQKAGMIEDARTLSPAWFDQMLSCCVLMEGRVCGSLLIHRLPSGALRPEMFYVKKPAGNLELLDMIRYVIYRAQDQLDGDTPVVIPRSSEAVRALTDKLLPGLKGNIVLTASRELSEKEV